MNAFHRALTAVNATLKRASGTSVKISRDGIESDAITAVKAGPANDQYDDAGAFVQRVRQIDWLIAPADYVIAGEIAAPADDDLILELDSAGDLVATYVVSSPTPGENPWRYTDADRTLMRVHVNED